jgi:hypothetical protein
MTNTQHSEWIDQSDDVFIDDEMATTNVAVINQKGE